METLFITFILTLVIFSLAILGLSIRMIFVKGAEFRGGCSSNNPMLKNDIGECQVCGAKPEEACKNDLPELKN